MLSAIFILTVIFGGARDQTVASQENKRTIIAGEVLKVGAQPNEKSEWLHRLIKYRVLDVCEGNYDKQEIIVSNLPDPEFDKLEVGTKVCFSVVKTVGPTVNEDWSVDVKGNEDHYFNTSLFLENCECQK